MVDCSLSALLLVSRASISLRKRQGLGFTAVNAGLVKTKRTWDVQSRLLTLQADPLNLGIAALEE